MYSAFFSIYQRMKTSHIITYLISGLLIGIVVIPNLLKGNVWICAIVTFPILVAFKIISEGRAKERRNNRND